MIRGRILAVALAVAVLLGALTTAASAQHVARGILFKLGEKLTTELTPSGDVDSFVFYGVEGVNVSLSLLPGTEGFAPTMTMMDEDDNVLDLSAYTKVKGAKTKVRSFPLPRTGSYFLRVTDPLGRTGQYHLKTKGDLARAPRLPKMTIGPGETVDFSFGASPGLTVDAKIKFMDRKKPVSVLSVYDPDGEEVPHGKGSFYQVSQGLLASMKMQSPARSSWRDDADERRVGPYGLTIGGASTPTSFKIKLKVRHEKGGGKRVVASTVPVITHCRPEFGRPGSRVIVNGANFLPGKIEVLFDDSYAREVRFLTPSTISMRSPYGEGEVDVTVFNSDGQEGMLEDAYIFIPNPPNVGSVSPEEGPDNGGTVVDVFGEQFTWVEKVKVGDVELAAAPNVIADFHLQFTTEAMAPGTYDLELTDKFGQRITYPDGFTFVAAPVLLSLSPPSGGGGRACKCIGQFFRPDHTVLVNGAPTPTTYWSPTELRWVTPPGVPGDMLDVGVRDVWGRTSTIQDAYEYAVSVGKLEELFNDTTMKDTGFTPSEGALADWNGTKNPGKLAATFGSTRINTPFTPSQQNSANSFPMGSGAKRVQNWMKQKEIGNAGTITALHWCPSTSLKGTGMLSNFTTFIGHSSSTTGLTSTTFASNFSSSPTTVINSVTYTTPQMTQGQPCAFPTFSKDFSYDGKSSLVIDNQKTALSGSTSSWWNRSDIKGRRAYQNNGVGATATAIDAYAYIYWIDFRNDTSMAQSLFYRTESDFTEFEDPVVAPTSQPDGTDYTIEYQGAKADPATGDPNPLTYTAWTEDPTTLIDMRYLRFRVTFKADLDSGLGPKLESILIPYLYFD